MLLAFPHITFLSVLFSSFLPFLFIFFFLSLPSLPLLSSFFFLHSPFLFTSFFSHPFFVIERLSTPTPRPNFTLIYHSLFLIPISLSPELLSALLVPLSITQTDHFNKQNTRRKTKLAPTEATLAINCTHVKRWTVFRVATWWIRDFWEIKFFFAVCIIYHSECDTRSRLQLVTTHTGAKGLVWGFISYRLWNRKFWTRQELYQRHNYHSQYEMIKI